MFLLHILMLNVTSSNFLEERASERAIKIDALIFFSGSCLEFHAFLRVSTI